jgi:predicted phosphodiesterase
MCNFLESREDIKSVVIVGDLFDLWVTSAGRSFKEAKYFLDYLYDRFQGNIIYLSGNHDEDLQFIKSLHGIPIKQFHHFNLGRKSVVVCHGHQYDHNFYLEKATLLAKGNAWVVNKVDRWLGVDTRKILTSLSDAIQKDPLGKIIFTYEHVLKQTFTGVHDIIITGHTHTPCIKRFNRLTYINVGDSMQHSTAVILEGTRFSLLDYIQGNEISFFEAGDTKT